MKIQLIAAYFTYALIVTGVLKCVSFVYFWVYALARKIGFAEVMQTKNLDDTQSFVIYILVKYEFWFAVSVVAFLTCIAFFTSEVRRYRIIIVVNLVLVALIFYGQYLLKGVFEPGLIGNTH